MHRSGIKVDDDLKKEFANAQKNENTSFLVIKLTDDKFSSGGSGPTTGDVKTDFDRIADKLKAAEPCYVLTRAGAPSGKWIVIFYVPDDSQVRLKMLYASSASALKEGLGAASFATDYSISAAKDCSFAAFQQSTKAVAREDIMTMDEIMKLEEQSASSHAMGQTRSSAIADLPLNLSPEATDALLKLRDSKLEAVIFALNAKTEVMEVEASAGPGKWGGSSGGAAEEIAKRMPAKEPRYAVYQFRHELEGKDAAPYVFLYYCPMAAMPRMKMTYSSCKSIAVKLCEKVGGFPVSKQYEWSEPGELTSAALLAELYPKAAEKKVFTKPKKPGKSRGLTQNTKFDAEK